MERRAMRVEPFSTWMERRRPGPINVVTIAGGFVFVSGLPPFDPLSGKAIRRPFPEQAEIVPAQMKQCLEAAGASLARVVKRNVDCTDESHFAAFNSAYDRFFVGDTPARIFLCVSAFPRPFDVEIDCVAVALPATRDATRRGKAGRIRP